MLRGARGEAGPVRALGAMSGTSLDGVDAAVLLTDGERIHGFGPAGYRPYSEAERSVLRAALGRWPGEPGVAEAAAVVDAAHAELLGRFPEAELVGFHGQTLAHEPGGRGTHQAGCGQALAAALGRQVVWDFRSADVALGGQGAPLAPFYHFACAQWMGAAAPVAFLNLGGVGNLTWVDPAAAAPEAAGALLAFDTGPANAPMDDLMQTRRDLPRDEGGALAATGRVAEDVVARLLDHPYLHRMPPKSLDRMDFPELPVALAGLSDADALATAAAFSAACVAAGMAVLPAPPSRLLVTGGGRHNPVLMRMIAERVAPCPVAPVEAAGLDGDMLEAQAFAHLAVRVRRGLPTSCPGTTGVAAAVGGGQLSDPAALPRPRLA
jgi:anhydro-N-acetylmuramic acid kinase